MCTYCGSGFILLISVQLYKQNRYRDTEIKRYVKGVKSSSIYPIRACNAIYVECVKSSSK